MLHRRLLRLAGRVRGPLTVGALLGLAVFVGHVLQAALVGHLLARVFTGRPLSDLTGPLLALVGVIVARAAVGWLREVCAVAMAGAIKRRLRNDLIERLVALGPGHLVRVRTGDVQATVVDGVEGLEAYYSRYLPQVTVCLVGPPLVVAWMLTQDAPTAVVVALAVVAVPTVPRLWDRVLRARGTDHWAAYGELSAEYLDAMQGISTLKALNATTDRRDHLAGKGERLYRATMRQMAVSLVDTGLSEAGVQIGTALALAVGAIRVVNGDLDPATLLTLLVLVGVVFRPFRDLAAAWHAGFLGVSAADGIGDLLDAPAPSPDRAHAAMLTIDRPVDIEFDAVTFTYPGRSTPALRGVSFRVSAGERVAVVGRSGAGKSTLVHLLMRFVSPDQGTVTIDGRDIAGCRADSVRAGVALVSQDTYLFTGTVAENLRLARPGATDDDLVAAATVAGAHAFVAAAPAGYGQAVGERGLTLSGGQRQRIAIARAVLKDAPVLVLDEATSAIDAAHEDAIVDALDRLAQGRTTLVIAHRLNTIRNADRIVVMDDGAVVESGTHHELIAAGGAYARLVAAQEVRA